MSSVAGERKRAVAYLRESTEDQAEGFSLDAQLQGIERAAGSTATY
jgi:DNA invertase Pin-like site-specific DNA recombinase